MPKKKIVYFDEISDFDYSKTEIALDEIRDDRKKFVKWFKSGSLELDASVRPIKSIIKNLRQND